MAASSGAKAYTATANVTFTWGGAAPEGNAKGWTSSGSNTLSTLTASTYFTTLSGNNSNSYFDADFATGSDYDPGTTDDDCLTPQAGDPGNPSDPGWDTIQLRRYGCRVADSTGYNSPLFKLTPVEGTGPAASATGDIVITDTAITGTLTVNPTTDEAGGATGYNYRSADGSPFGNVWHGVSSTATLTLNLTGTFTATSWEITGGTARLEDPSFQCQQGGFGGIAPGFILCNPSTVAGGFQSNGAGLSWGWDWDGAGTGTVMGPIPVFDTGGTTLQATLPGVLASLVVDGGGNITTTIGEYRSGLGSSGSGCPTSIRWSGSAINCGTLTAGPLVITGTAVPEKAPTVTLSASPATVDSGDASTLTWNSDNATSCAASGAWTGTRPTSGTESTSSLTASATYTLTCTGPGGVSSQSVTVTVNLPPMPTVTLVATPALISAGAASALTWSSTNATSCTASGGWSGARATSGSQFTGSLTASTTYTLTCSGAGGSSAETTTVTVAASGVPTVILSASPPVVGSGAASVLTWSSLNTTVCTGSGGWSGTKATSGAQSTGSLTANTTFTLTCTGGGGAASQSATVVVDPALSGQRTASVTLSWGGAGPGGNAKSWTSSGANTLTQLSDGTYFTARTGYNSSSYFDADFATSSNYDPGTTDDDCLTPQAGDPGNPSDPGWDTIQLRRYGCRVSDSTGYNSPLFKLTPVQGTGPAASATGEVVITDTTITGILTVNSTTDEAGGATGYNYRSADGSPFGNVWYGVSSYATLTLNLTGNFTGGTWQITGGTARLEDPSFQCQQGGYGGSAPGFILCNPSTVSGGFQNNGAGLSFGWDLDGAGTGTAMGPIPVYDTAGTALQATLQGVLASLAVDGGGNITTNTGEYRSGLGNTGGGCPTSLRWSGTAINCGTLTVGPLIVTGRVTSAPIDSSPDGFSFLDQTDAPLDAPVTSSAIAITGINVSTVISVSGAPSSQYSINDGPFTSLAGAVGNGSTVRLRHTSSIIPDTAESTVLNVGGVTDTFTSTTIKYAFDDGATTPLNTPVVISILENDLGFPEPVYAGVWVDPRHGTATVNGSPGAQSGITLTYTPNPGYSGSDSLQYWVEGGSVVDYGLVSINVINNDVDGDGVIDTGDNCPLVANPGQQDGDVDGVGDACDNCTERVNANQRDTNGDGYGNICDADLNNSGVVTAADYAIFRTRINTNNADADFNGSGVVTALDYSILRSYLNQPPGPSGLHPN